MSVGVSQFIRHLPFNGSSDPSLPTGIWLVDVESTGDASGGENSLDVGFSTTDSFDDSFYSLEQFLTQHDAVTSLSQLFQAASQKNLVTPTTPITSTVLMVSSGTGIAGVTGWNGRALAWLPYFCGQAHNDLAGVQLFLRFRITNTDTVAFRVHAWGYQWSSRCIATPTGPRRPPDSVFG